MSGGDMCFTDETDGAVWRSSMARRFCTFHLQWRARNAVNFLARVHYIVPQMDRIAVVHEDEEYEPSGMEYTRPDYVNFGQANGGPRYPADLHAAHAGEKLPIAIIPDGVTFRPGDESVYGGRGSFYSLRYGPYLIGMNPARPTKVIRW